MPFVPRRTNPDDQSTGISVPARTGITMEIATLHRLEVPACRRLEPAQERVGKELHSPVFAPQKSGWYPRCTTT